MLSLQKILPASAFAVLLMFSAGHADLPPQFFSKAGHVKTCCGRVVCECRHAKKAPCPFKLHSHAHEGHVVSGRKPCHLKKDNAGRAAHAVHSAREDKTPFFRKAPCHSEKAPASSPVHAREYFFSRPGISGRHETSVPYFFPASPSYDFFSGRPIDHPPRLF